ncbi:hypothetical protein D9613_010856 [Agrocybe pediades]|uniref:Uncharacterized protein n=1 Tax=Agrocybe pediades TaxID=84607 RepID=A0A8H4QL85_9AGAR|nr:hypothetical protein D9613_010856 [Agrocybe pediades]
MLVITDALHSLLEQRKKMWAFLHEPAPRLRWVDLSVDTMDADEFLPVPWNLFADKAPLLTEFRMDRYKFWTDASWIPNLCDVTFYSDFHPSEALEAVQRMPRLQYLDVSIGIGTVDYRGPVITLPRLKTPGLHARDFVNAGTFLQRIAPSADRCLYLRVYRHEPLPVPGEYEEYEATAAKHIIPYFSLNPPSVVTFIVDDVISSFYGDCSFVRRRTPKPQVFGISFHTLFLPSSLLMKQISTSKCFSQVTELHLRTASDWDFLAPPFDFDQLKLATILSAFSSLKTFSTIDEILHSLLKEPTTTTTLFPGLTTLQVYEPSKPGAPAKEPPHQRFLAFRKAIGRPLSVFKMSFRSTPYVRMNEVYNLDYLEVEHAGLLVKWKIIEDPLSGMEEYLRCY